MPGRRWGRLEGLGPLPFLMPKYERRVPMSREEFKEGLLQIMEEKTHWADAGFPALVDTPLMRHHFRDEYAVFVKPFPYYLRGALKQLPKTPRGGTDQFADVRRDLRENIEEEETGKHHAGESHAELFLRIPKDPAFGFDVSDFDNGKLLPRARRYKDFLTKATHTRGWEVAVAVSTLFLEGNKRERSNFYREYPGMVPWRGLPLNEHPLHVHKGVSLDSLRLVEIHHTLDSVDGDHRLAAWRMILEHIPQEKRFDVLVAMREALEHWKIWRDEVAENCGLTRDREGRVMKQA